MRARPVALAALFWTCVSCMAQSGVPLHSKVWSSANSDDGYASCPRDTTVTGGGFEMSEMSLGHLPLVIASRPEGNGWRVVCDDPVTGQRSAGCRAWALCASVLQR